MNFKKVFLGFLSLFFIFLLVSYVFLSSQEINFDFEKNSEFNLDGSMNMQFYENMRFPDRAISYEISPECSIRKRYDMEEAFDILENLTVLEFYESEAGEIRVNCDETAKFDGGLFIAGEGGPTNITSGNLFNVISSGNILLIRDSNCERPNVALHELLHVMGFNHSSNSNNIMYPVSKCRQTIGEEIVNEIDFLYSTDSLPELGFANLSAMVKGNFLNFNASIRNDGLKDAGPFVLKVFSEGKEIKSFDFEGIEVGYELKINIENVLIKKIKIEGIEFVIENSYDEIYPNNNKIILEKITT